MFNVEIKVTLKTGVLDPEGEAVKGSLASMDYSEVSDVRVGKLINLTLAGDNREEVAGRVEEMCERLLTNPVLENYQYDIVEVSQS